MMNIAGEENEEKINGKSKKELLIEEERVSCYICSQKITGGKHIKFINQSMFKKYSSSQNYYYTKNINEILYSIPSHAFSFYRDFMIYDKDTEYFSHFYQKGELKGHYINSIQANKDLEYCPNFYMKPISQILKK